MNASAGMGRHVTTLPEVDVIAQVCVGASIGTVFATPGGRLPVLPKYSPSPYHSGTRSRSLSPSSNLYSTAYYHTRIPRRSALAPQTWACHRLLMGRGDVLCGHSHPQDFRVPVWKMKRLGNVSVSS